jgi:ribosomal protein L16 Arg81 hydroxylase
MNDELRAQRRSVPPVDRPALRRCVGDDVESFATKHWGSQPLLRRADELPARFTDLLSLDAVDELLSRRGLRSPFLRMARDGTVIDAKRWTRSGGAGAEIADQVADEAVGELFADGATAVLQGLHRTWPPIIELATQLALDLGHPVQVNAYITPPSSRGFAAHYDVHDVFVLQVAGEKRWTIHEPVLVAPLRSQVWQDRRGAVEDRAAEPALLDAVLAPGDALYLPRGYLHAAEALGDVSVHLTIGVHSVTRFAVAEALLDAAADDPALRGSLPLGVDLSDPEAVRPYVVETVQALITRLDANDPDEAVRRVRRRTWQASRPAPVRPLAQAAAAAAVTVDTVVVLRPGLRALLHDRDQPPVLELPHRRLRLPAGSGSAARALIAGEPVATGDLGLTDEVALELVALLLRTSVVVPANRRLPASR